MLEQRLKYVTVSTPESIAEDCAAVRALGFGEDDAWAGGPATAGRK